MLWAPWGGGELKGPQLRTQRGSERQNGKPHKKMENVDTSSLYFWPWVPIGAQKHQAHARGPTKISSKFYHSDFCSRSSGEASGSLNYWLNFACSEHTSKKVVSAVVGIRRQFWIFRRKIVWERKKYQYYTICRAFDCHFLFLCSVIA